MSRELKALRVRHGYTQKVLAELLDLGETSYTKRENGVASFTLEEVKKMKEIFHLSPEQVIEIFFEN